MEYTKPTILSNEEMTEGVYTASGESAESTGSGAGPVCQSIYRQGVFQPNEKHNFPGVPDSEVDISVRGCEGCHASYGDRCGLTTGNVNFQGDFRPEWEKQGMAPGTHTYDGKPM